MLYVGVIVMMSLVTIVVLNVCVIVMMSLVMIVMLNVGVIVMMPLVMIVMLGVGVLVMMPLVMIVSGCHHGYDVSTPGEHGLWYRMVQTHLGNVTWTELKSFLYLLEDNLPN